MFHVRYGLEQLVTVFGENNYGDLALRVQGAPYLRRKIRS
jgi:hypothetical protein